MEENKQLTLLTAVKEIVTLAENSGLGCPFFEMAESYITYFSERQGISKMQTVLLAIFIESSAGNRKVSLADIAEFLDCKKVQVLQHKDEVDALIKKGMLRMMRDYTCESLVFCIPQEFLDSLAEDKPFQRKSYKGATGIEFFQHLYDITHLRHEDEISSDYMVDEIQRLMNDNPQLPFVKALRNIEMSPMCEVVIAHMCRHLVLTGTESLSIHHLGFLFESRHQINNFDREMASGHHYLIKEGWLENAFSEGFKEKNEYQLTEKARETLLQGFDVRLSENKCCDVLQSKSIATKELFFTDAVCQQLNSLEELLEESHYHSVCARLKEKGLRQGFTCLFYGAPGTGKTESVFQLAKKTGRDLMQVNISQIKSMWVGESEKNIKALFDRYRMVAKHSKRIPILLFNEADAIIGKRQEGAERAVDKMENSIQNIILQEMESLEGIMIATTNLVQNIDAAFERRFLYKVKFEKPELAQRAKIWRSMMPELSEETSERLASAYNFSGGQIENIIRKCDIESILYGNDYVTDERIDQYCREEKIMKKDGTRIGFN